MNLAAQLESALPADRLAELRLAAEIAATQDVPLWLVGGPVRDLLLARPITDLDLVVEGDAPAVAELFAGATGGRITTHAAFGTATVALDAAWSIDFVTARSEHYPQPAVLPVVTPATIVEDLRRRDFTVNTLALSLAPPSWGEVLDLCGGLADLEARRIQVLHSSSFVDDPTRIVRAARFAGRLDYAVEAQTLAWMTEGTAFIQQTTPARILHELRLLVREPAPEACLMWLARAGALQPLRITWQADWGTEAFRAVRSIDLGAVAVEQVLLGLLAPGAVEWPAYYPLTTSEQRMFRQVAAASTTLTALLAPGLTASKIDQLLQPFDLAALWVLCFSPPWCVEPVVLAYLNRYIDELRHIQTLLTGDDLHRLGLPPGPRYRDLLAGVRAAQLDGLLQDQETAEEWVRAHL